MTIQSDYFTEKLGLKPPPFRGTFDFVYNVSGMVRNRKLSKAISDLGWREFRTLTENKCEKYGRELRVISRWEPTSQRCSVCGFKGCLLYTSPSPRDISGSRMPSSA